MLEKTINYLDKFILLLGIFIIFFNYFKDFRMINIFYKINVNFAENEAKDDELVALEKDFRNNILKCMTKRIIIDLIFIFILSWISLKLLLIFIIIRVIIDFITTR
mgnify:CR=1 FL=1